MYPHLFVHPPWDTHIYLTPYYQCLGYIVAQCIIA